jgi:hypothetical protein
MAGSSAREIDASKLTKRLTTTALATPTPTRLVFPSTINSSLLAQMPSSQIHENIFQARLPRAQMQQLRLPLIHCFE